MKQITIPLAITLSLAAARAGSTAARSEDPGKPVKVFILAGQSNMEGKAQNTLLEHQALAPETKALFAQFRRNGKWIVRDDVFIKFLGRKGGLTVGYGSPGRTGVELEFGTVLGDHFDEPILLIKAAWGGHALFKQFRPPSAGMPDQADLEAELRKARERVARNNEKRKRSEPLPTMAEIQSVYGSSYRKMLAEVKDTFEHYRTMFPKLKGRKLEVAGFVWFHGWNDMYGAQDHYAENMAHFIRDVRKDFRAPAMPFVIAVMGQNGSKPAKGAMLTIQKAQLSIEHEEEFRGNVRAVRTDLLVDKAAEKLFPGWKQHLEQWQRVGSDRPYHYLGSAIWTNRIGHALAEAMLELMERR